MSDVLWSLTAPATLAAFAEGFKTVIGVLLSLAGLGLVVMGGIALADRSWKSGGGAFVIGLVMLLGGMWLVGALSV